MPTIDYEVKLDFSDVLLVPKRSELESRKDVEPERTFIFKHSKRIWHGVPVVVANMDTTGTIQMTRVLQKYKMITCLHKFYTVDEIPDDLDPDYYAISTGITEKDLVRLDDIILKKNPHFVCLDVANGYSVKFIETVKIIRTKYPMITLIAGNIVTADLVQELALIGVDLVKAGVGSGSCCTTRLQTGVGYPQMSAVLECANAAHGMNIRLMSDGGIQNVGDISKAFAGGADFVMCGSMFAGHDECNGKLIEENSKMYHIFYGMSSTMAMEIHHGGIASYRSSEGKCVKVPYKGKVEDTVLNILGGIRSTMTYIGAKKLKDMSKCGHFIRVNNQVNRIYSGSEHNLS